MPNQDLSANFFVRLNSGKESAAEQVDRLFRERLCSLVEREMDKRFAARESPEDAVQSALRSFYRGIDEQRFRIDSTGAMWRLLEQITRHKVLKHAEYHNAGKRSPQTEGRGEEASFPAREPAPEEAAAVADLIESVLLGLDDESTEVFRLRFQGCTRAEIAKRMQCTETAVRVKLERVRARLRRLLEDGSNE